MAADLARYIFNLAILLLGAPGEQLLPERLFLAGLLGRSVDVSRSAECERDRIDMFDTTDCGLDLFDMVIVLQAPVLDADSKIDDG